MTKKEIKIEIRNFKKNFYIFITLIILINYIIFLFIFIRNKIAFSNLYKNVNITFLKENITKSIQNEISFIDIDCIFVKNKLKKRTQPFEFENELLFFYLFNFM